MTAHLIVFGLPEELRDAKEALSRGLLFNDFIRPHDPQMNNAPFALVFYGE